MENELKARTKRVGLETIKIVQRMPSDQISNIITKQLIRSSISIGANYRAACRAKSGPDFINKLKRLKRSQMNLYTGLNY